jgi:hypothetical protein
MKSSAMSSEELDTLLAGYGGGRFPKDDANVEPPSIAPPQSPTRGAPHEFDLERLFRPGVIRAARGQVETEVPLSGPRWPRAVR